MKTERLPQERSEARTTPRAWLIRAGVASDPLAPPELFDLEPHSQMVLGRLDDGVRGEGNLIPSDDRWMSRTHARLERRPDGWYLADLGSSNGTLVGGRRTSAAVLQDGDIIETGGTFWVFRNDAVDDLPPPMRPDDLGSLVPRFVRVVDRAERVARSRVPIMILGETGTGKELFAQYVHRWSGRKGPFVAINTAAVQSHLVASELFGVERGAHSMAERSRAGQVRAANGGTLLLDEVGDMPPEVQVTLLRVLQENEVLPVGGDTPVPIDVRFICATHQDIPLLAREGRFRADLLARLQGTTFRLPSLAERREDIGLLVARFLRQCGAAAHTLSPAAYRALMLFDWPLNIRQLQRAVESAVAVCDDDRLELSHLPEEIQDFEPSVERDSAGQAADRESELVRLLTAHRGNVSAVARSMGYSRMQVHRWLKQYGIKPDDYRGA